ncbi:MAG: fimbrillin family protein [Prevotella sp.]|nr:fimbrillin family protein [Prevotella sp.]MBQ6917956.1 fimbrillin family protein [Prevotella sp.]
MRKILTYAVSALALASCSSDSLVSDSPANTQSPIAFSVEKKNITRGVSLESTGRHNFGVWAYKYKTATATSGDVVMGNYLVGYSDGAGKGYDNTGVTTWDASAGEITDHKSPWFYENLGTAQYLNETASKGYTKDQSAFMSANANQYLRYWDLAYNNTKFYAYTPYKATGVTFSETDKKITVENGILSAGYSAPANEFLYAGAVKTNANKEDVELKFKHLGAQVKLRFYEDIDGYDVDIIDVTTSGSGIQATPATKTTTTDDTTTPATTTTTYATSSYYTVCGAEVNYSSSVENPTATATYGDDATSKSSDNLVFKVPSGTIPAAVTSGDQGYATSETTYYAVPQPATSTTGFTFHVSYTLKAKDNGETITVHDARVFVPASVTSGGTTTCIAAWQPNTIYYYTFKITKDATGTTDPNDDDISISDPKVPDTKALYPIVFDGATIENYENAVTY